MYKNYIWGTFNILVLWESCIKTLPTNNLFLTPRCIMQRGVKIQTWITLRIWNQIWKKFSIWIRAQDGHFWYKNQSCKISRYCTFNPITHGPLWLPLSHGLRANLYSWWPSSLTKEGPSIPLPIMNEEAEGDATPKLARTTRLWGVSDDNIARGVFRTLEAGIAMSS